MANPWESDPVVTTEQPWQSDPVVEEPKQEGGVVSGIAAGIGRMLNPIHLIQGALDIQPRSGLQEVMRTGRMLRDIVGGASIDETVRKEAPEIVQQQEALTGKFGTREQAAEWTGLVGQAALLALPALAKGRVKPTLRETAFGEKPVAPEAMPQTPEPPISETVPPITPETVQPVEEVIPSATTQTVQADAQKQTAGVGVPSGGEIEVPVGAYGKSKVSPEIAQFIGNFGYGRSHLNQFLIDAYKAAEKGDQAGIDKNLRFLRKDLRSLGDEDFRENVQKVRDFFEFDFKPTKGGEINAEQIQGPARANVDVQLPVREGAREVYGGEMPSDVGGEGVLPRGQGETLQQTPQEVAAPVPQPEQPMLVSSQKSEILSESGGGESRPAESGSAVLSRSGVEQRALLPSGGLPNELGSGGNVPPAQSKPLKITAYRGGNPEGSPNVVATDGGYYGEGVYFSESPSVAQDYAKKSGGSFTRKELSFQKPLILDYTNYDSALKSKTEATNLGIKLNGWGAFVDSADATSKLKANGYDGVIIKKTNEPSEIVQFPKSPSQTPKGGTEIPSVGKPTESEQLPQVGRPEEGAATTFAPYADEILKSAKYVDNPAAREAIDAGGMYHSATKEINLPSNPSTGKLAQSFVKAHEEAHHIWDGLQNITAAEMMRADPEAFSAFKETAAGKSQIIRHKIKGENVNDPSYFDWIEAVPDLYAEMKVKAIRNPALENWLEKAIPEKNKPTPSVPPPAAPPPVETAVAPEAPKGTGISSERFREQYGDDAPVPNTGRSPKQFKEIGVNRLDNFQKTGDVRDDPYTVLTNLREGKVSVKQVPDDIALLRAEHQRLQNAARAAEGTPEWEAKSESALGMAQAIKEVAHGPASDTFRSLQEYDKPRYDNVTDFDQAFRERMGRESTSQERVQFKKMADDVTNTRNGAEEAINGVQKRLNKMPKMKFEDAYKNIQDQITELTKDCIL